ncbi:MAG TPA: hypothetical protein VGM88_06615 [Kofleriaceae bacterium]|jgi:hypothetical protein
MYRYLLLSMLLVAACKKKDAEPAAGSAAAAAPKATCPAGATKEAAGGFCLTLPANWHELPAGDFAGKKEYKFHDASNNHEVSVTVGAYDGNQAGFDSSISISSDMVKTKTGFALVPIPGGKFNTYQDEDGVWGVSWVHDAKSVYECHTRESPTDKSPEIPTINAACKTVVGLL